LSFRAAFWSLQFPEVGTILWLSVQETGRGLVFRGRKILKQSVLRWQDAVYGRDSKDAV
jgi:hypothetical protein